MILQINEITAEELTQLVGKPNYPYYIGHTELGRFSAIIDVDRADKLLLLDLFRIMSNKT